MSIETNENKSKKNIGKIIGKVFSGIGIAICVLLVVLIIWLGVDKFILKSPVPSVFGYSSLRVATGSMTGTIDQGSFVLIKNTGDYEVNDIITFFPTGDTTPTTHRIIGVDEEGKFITKGDNPANSVDKEHIRVDQIVGEYVTHLDAGPFIGWMFEMGWIYLVAAALIIAMGIVLIKYDQMSQQAQNAQAQPSQAQPAEQPAEASEQSFDEQNNDQKENESGEDQT